MSCKNCQCDKEMGIASDEVLDAFETGYFTGHEHGYEKATNELKETIHKIECDLNALYENSELYADAFYESLFAEIRGIIAQHVWRRMHQHSQMEV